MNNKKCGGFFYIERRKKHFNVEKNLKLLFGDPACKNKTEIELFWQARFCKFPFIE